jgi:hypothetical protein
LRTIHVPDKMLCPRRLTSSRLTSCIVRHHPPVNGTAQKLCRGNQTTATSPQSVLCPRRLPVTVWLNRGCVPVTERRIRGDWKMLWPHHSHPPLSSAVSPLRRPITVRLNRGCVPFAAPPRCGRPSRTTHVPDKMLCPRHNPPVTSTLRSDYKMLCPHHSLRTAAIKKLLCPHHSPTHHSRCCQVLCPRNGRSPP